ncbi:hypothetical protein [Gracilibacillus sp. D59]|uniref:hypothetical protein n=1 Tax=Gracilibacillus sp. D59 TaxID=3457434 RepID=UPI003FCEAC8F
MQIKARLTITLIIILLLSTSCATEEKVTYNGRTYNNPVIYTADKFIEKYGQVELLEDKVNGMEVMISEDGEKVLKKYKTVPTLLFLKKNDEEFLVYTLQGGP